MEESLPHEASREYYSHHAKVTISDTCAAGAFQTRFAHRSPVQFNHVLRSLHGFEQPVSSPSEEPAWKQRAVERSIKTAKLRAAQRVQRFLDAAQAIIIEKGSTDFTVQEVVDRSRQSLRSFYLQFDGKHELLLALFEDALSRSADQIRAATDGHSDPLERLKVAVTLLFETSRPDPSARRPLFTDFAPRLLVSHPSEVKVGPRAAACIADRTDGRGSRRRRSAHGHQCPTDGRDDDANGHVHRRAVRRRRRGRRNPSDHR